MRRAGAALWAALALLWVAACGGGATGKPADPSVARVDGPGAEPESAEEGGELPGALAWQAPGNVPSSDQIPIDGRDASWGQPTAPVTLVAFTDLQCPFCLRAHETVERLKQDYGPDTLRVVYKHNPLPFHQDAFPAAIAAQAVYELGGPEAFFAFVSTVFRNQQSLSDANLVQYAEDAGVDRGALLARTGAPDVRAKVQSDMDLAKKLGALGTPAFRINGIVLSGAQPYEKFAELIDAEKQAAQEASARGVGPARIYAERVAKNFVAPPPPSPSSASPSPVEDKTVWKIAVGKSPTLGPADALVTMIEFADYQCPFCKRVQPTIDALMTRYKGQLRLVYKHNPLPFHNRAMPASLFAVEARAQKGDKGFWAAHKRLWENQHKLEDSDLLALAGELKLNTARVKHVLAKQSHKATIQDDADLANDLEARGTPAFFINGRKLAGAQPIERFAEVIDEELAKAKDLVAKKKIPAARVYAELMKDAKGPPPPETKKVKAATKANPSRGKGAVAVHVFSDFQCPFCKRAVETIKDLEKAYPGQVKIVWRNLPLPFHQLARPAAAAAMEAHAQGGNAAFWKMHDLLFAAQGTPGGLERPALEAYAAQIGLDVKRFRQALDDRRHEALIKTDEADAQQAGISGTPAFVINGYYVSGAQPLGAFKKVVKRALDDLRKGKRP
jgi:protein-disulfide isomerase